MNPRISLSIGLIVLGACGPADHYDVLITGGTVYDGSGSPGIVADVAMNDDRVAAIGDLSGATGDLTVEASGLAVAPGFVNMLSFTGSLIIDGRSQGDIRQGVTLEVFGEWVFMGPMTDEMKADRRQEFEEFSGELDVTALLGSEGIPWSTLGEQLDFLEEKGVSPNIASFVSATAIRKHELGNANRAPNAEELARMVDQVRVSMEEGAVGLASSLIYAPAFYASTEELIALATEAAALAREGLIPGDLEGVFVVWRVIIDRKFEQESICPQIH